MDMQYLEQNALQILTFSMLISGHEKVHAHIFLCPEVSNSGPRGPLSCCF